MDYQVRLELIRVLIARNGAVIVFEQEAKTLPGERAGHEHFGFKDGISQPGVRDFHREDPRNPGRRLGHPGEELIAPGEFILGYDTQVGKLARVPDWMLDGSFQVVRRLKQDVPGWWSQMRQADELDPPLPEEALAAKLVGRWRSGTPLARAPKHDTGVADDNTFDFADDPDGESTPRFAHIRKVYPRASEPPGEEEGERRRIMRRGIPFGPHFDPPHGHGHAADAERGLMFQCFCASLEDQFEFLQRQWVNNSAFPNMDDGPDPVIGRDGTNTLQRTSHRVARLSFRQFVSTSGAIYAFAPSIPTLRRLAAGNL